MADIIGIDGQRKTSNVPPTATKTLQPHNYTIIDKSGSQYTGYGKLFFTPLFVAIENAETQEFDFLLALDEFSRIMNNDAIEPTAA